MRRDQALGAVADGTAKQQGMAVGAAAAQMMIAVRAGDGSNIGPFVDRNYPQKPGPGQYRFIGADTTDDDLAFAPKWGHVTPFVYDDITTIRPRPPYTLDSRRYADDFNEVKEMADVNSTARSPEQTQIALFWMESRRCAGTESRGPSPVASTHGRRPGCSGCSTRRKPMATSPTGTPSTTSTTGGARRRRSSRATSTTNPAD